MPTETFELIGTATSTGSSPTLSITSIPNTYKHLYLYAQLRSSDSRNGGQSAALYFNSDTSASYSKLYYGEGTSGYQANVSAIELSCVMNGSTANTFWTNEITINDYKNTNMYKWCWMRTGSGNFQGVAYQNGLYRSTNAITRLDITEGGSLNWVSGSTISLYGLVG